MEDKNMKRLIAVVVLIISIGLFAYSYVIGGSNLGVMGYPSFSASKPYQPYAATTYVSGSYSSVKTVSKWEYDSYKRDVESYVSDAKEFIENGNNDIKRIQDA